MTTGVVVFDYEKWITRYPEFSVSVPDAQPFFDEAQLYCNNTAESPVAQIETRAVLLNMLTAHIAALSAGVNGEPASPLVGRINSASEGSVSVQTQSDYPPGTVHWYQQTKYGAAFWAATNKYRTMRYVAGAQPRFR